jgi:hypothetical protein
MTEPLLALISHDFRPTDPCTAGAGPPELGELASLCPAREEGAVVGYGRHMGAGTLTATSLIKYTVKYLIT